MRPPEYDALRRLDPVEQVAGQIHCTNRCIEAALAGLPPERGLTVDYERLWRYPAQVWVELGERLEVMDHYLPPDYVGPKSFDVMNQVRVDGKDAAAIAAAWEYQTGEICVPS